MTITNLLNEILDQPRALRELAAGWPADGKILQIERAPSRVLLTGMGASFHAAAIGALHLNSLGVNAAAVEAADLINYRAGHPSEDTLLFYLSQSGSSGEVVPLFERLDGCIRTVAVTNNPLSELSRRAQHTLPVCAGSETLVATKTYLNSLAVLWLAVRRLSGAWTGKEIGMLYAVADRVESLLQARQETAQQMMETFDPEMPLLFLGHGPHAYTARQAAMVLSEWAKLPALHFGIGAFRHGFIEAVQERFGAVVFASPGCGAGSAHALAQELAGYGVRVLLVENGLLRAPGDQSVSFDTDEFLSPLLDILPAQIYTEALAKERGWASFRYIRKIVTDL